jgi:hypothetical protein
MTYRLHTYNGHMLQSGPLWSFVRWATVTFCWMTRGVLQMTHCDLCKMTHCDLRMTHCDLLQNEPLWPIVGWPTVTTWRIFHCYLFQDDPMWSITWRHTVTFCRITSVSFCTMTHCGLLLDDPLWSSAGWPIVTYRRMTHYSLLQDDPLWPDLWGSGQGSQRDQGHRELPSPAQELQPPPFTGQLCHWLRPFPCYQI